MKRGIEPIRHATLGVKSDHLGIYLEARIWNNGRSAVVRFGSVNIGPAHVRDVIRKSVTVLGRRGVLVLVEAGGQLDAIEDEADVYGYRLFGRTTAPGAASTVVLVGPEVKTRAAWWRRLLARLFAGPGAGPDHNKPKGANGGLAVVEGVTFGAWAIHALASQYRRRRWVLTLRMARLLTAITFRRRTPQLVGGDWNTNLVNGRLGKWLLRRGWTNEHVELGPLNTMHGAPIDGFAWRRALTVRR